MSVSDVNLQPNSTGIPTIASLESICMPTRPDPGSDRAAISMFVSDINIQPKRKPAMPPWSPLFGVPMYAQRARSWVGSGPVIEDVNPR